MSPLAIFLPTGAGMRGPGFPAVEARPRRRGDVCAGQCARGVSLAFAGAGHHIRRGCLTPLPSRPSTAALRNNGMKVRQVQVPAMLESNGAGHIMASWRGRFICTGGQARAAA